MLGKEIRLSKIINPADRRTCVIPMDHAVTQGGILGLSNAASSIERIGVEKPDAFILHKGAFSQLEGKFGLLSRGNFILHLSASTELNSRPVHKCLVSSVEQAVCFGAVGVSMHVNLGNSYEAEMLADLGKTAEQCYRWGMPLLAMMYVRNDVDENKTDAEQIAHAARAAQELGADIVKISCPEKIEELSRIIESVQIPVVISGGEKMDESSFLTYVDAALHAGASGVSAGRNIFQSRHPEKQAAWVSDLVHKRKTLSEILKNIKLE